MSIDLVFKPISYILGIFVSFVVVISIYMVKLDYDSQSVCNNAIVEFVDRSRATGYISAANYMEMMTKITNTGNVYEITISHDSRTCSPLLDESGNEIEGKYGYSYNAYYDDEILEVVFPEGNEFGQYYMKNGDMLKVSFRLKNPTFGARLYSFWTTRTFSTIRGSYSGYVGSKEETGI